MTARQAAKPKISDANANEIFDAITNGFEHTANLAIDSLSQDNAQADGRHGVESRNPCSLTVEKNSAQQFRRSSGPTGDPVSLRIPSQFCNVDALGSVRDLHHL
jgi:hypothetical protein